MNRTKMWEDFFGDDFFKNGKNGTIRSVPKVEDLRETDISAISARLDKFWKIYAGDEFSTEGGLPSLGDTKVSHFGYTCNILKENCALLKESQYDGEAYEIKKYLEDTEYQKFVDSLLTDLVSQAQNMNPKAAEHISDEEKQEDETDRAEEQVDLLGMLNGLENTQREAAAAAQSALKAERVADDAQKTAGNAHKTADDAQKTADSAQKIAEGILPNILTTLGIFVAIIVAVVACYLSLLLSQHFKDARPLNITICLLMGHILTNVICLLLYLTSKMTSFTLSCSCPIGNKKDCGLCSPEKQRPCTLVNKIWLKYPYVVLLNGAFSLAYVGLGLWNIGRKYLGKKIDGMLLENPLLVLALVLAIILALFIFIRVMIGCLRWKDCDDKANRTVTQKIKLIISGTKEFYFRCVERFSKCLTAPFQRIWTYLVRIVEKKIDVRRENSELKREVKELERRIGELEAKTLTEVGED